MQIDVKCAYYIYIYAYYLDIYNIHIISYHIFHILYLCIMIIYPQIHYCSHHEDLLIHGSFFGKEATVPPRAEVLWLSEVCTTWYQKALGATKSDKSCRRPAAFFVTWTYHLRKTQEKYFSDILLQLKIAKKQKEWELFWVSSIHEILMLRLLGLRFLCLWTMLKLQHSPKAQLRLLS